MKQNKLDKQLSLIYKKTNESSKYLNLKELKTLINSRKSSNRIFALLIIRKQIQKSYYLKTYFSLSQKLINDSNNNCRWQALIVIGEYLDKYPDDIYNVIIKYGSSKDDDMRSAIATILLEHLLEIDFKKYFSLYKNASKDNTYLLDTLSKCWVNGINSRENKIIKEYLKKIVK